MDDLGASFAGFDDPLETNGMVLRHRRSHDQDRISVAQVLLRSGCAAAPEARPQTGDSGAVSYPGLVGDAHHSQAGGKEFSDQVILFVVERRTAKVANGFRLHQ